MNTLVILSNDVFKLLNEYMHLFVSFEHLYLFGSSLYSNFVNDIDLLVIYKEYSNKISEDIKLINENLEKATGLPIHLTVLSIEEEKEIGFLKKITPCYLKLK